MTDRNLTPKELKDLKVLAVFTSTYCRQHHKGDRQPLVCLPGLGRRQAERYSCCTDCRDLLSYAFDRRLRCPLDPKPTCKHCPVHCYRPGHREKVREIMRFSGAYLLKRGRLDLLWHYFF